MKKDPARKPSLQGRQLQYKQIFTFTILLPLGKMQKLHDKGKKQHLIVNYRVDFHSYQMLFTCYKYVSTPHSTLATYDEMDILAATRAPSIVILWQMTQSLTFFIIKLLTKTDKASPLARDLYSHLRQANKKYKKTIIIIPDANRWIFNHYICSNKW